MTGRRVAITGVGVVSPHGCDAGPMFDALLAGRSAVRKLVLESSVGQIETVGAAVDAVSFEGIPAAQRVTSDRISLYAMIAAGRAIDDAHAGEPLADPTRIGVSVGTSLGGTISQEDAYVEMLDKRKSRLSPFTLVKVMYNGPAAQIALRHGLRGPSLTYTTTCSSSAVAIGEAARQIRHGYADAMIAGGAEALFSYVSIKAWQALQVLARPRDDDVSATCRPFSADRTGTVLGDGAAFVVLEDLERARARGAHIYAELAGYAVCNDASHMTQPSVEEQVRTMRGALEDAGCRAEDVDYLNAHGTATERNDVAETAAIRQSFGTHADRLAVSSTKSMHGHLVGAAGALELAVCALAIERQAVPPTAHLHVRDPRCDLDYVPHAGRDARVRAAMTNSFAVGGTAASLVLRRV
jgi:3-oxoacyl-[acyl-carrier-protein] synthase II